MFPWKYERELTWAIKHEDIIPFLNDVFPKAFGWKKVNQQAIADQGWNPLNIKLLEHPSIMNDTKDDFPSLNLKIADRIGASVLDRII